MPITIKPKQSEEDNERDAREAAVAGPLKEAKKRVVSKKELEASEFTNLRDFLNNERGLKRRDGKPVEQKNSVKTEAKPAKVEAEPVKTKTKAEEKLGTFGARGRNLSPANPSKYKKGGKVESKLMGKEGRGMAKATMQKVASKAVKGHESRMHKMKSIDGVALRGKTRGRMM